MRIAQAAMLYWAANSSRASLMSSRDQLLRSVHASGAAQPRDLALPQALPGSPPMGVGRFVGSSHLALHGVMDIGHSATWWHSNCSHGCLLQFRRTSTRASTVCPTVVSLYSWSGSSFGLGMDFRRDPHLHFSVSVCVIKSNLRAETARVDRA